MEQHNLSEQLSPRMYESYTNSVEQLKKHCQDASDMDAIQNIETIVADLLNENHRLSLENADIERVANMKTDFLANMSHEIRTPMNAVIGMAEMALREELNAAAQNYLTQIKSSGRALLGIINDILDFSKIDSGKMDICPVEYEPLSLMNDIANILVTRLKDKMNVELQLRMNPNLPCRLYGDNLRVRQVLINLANNAVKFTNRGHVIIDVDYEQAENDTIMLVVAVKDTGIGIKEEDLAAIFESFRQVDSKRNRNIEGTGLGLAISKRLMELMDGELSVESEYEKGSTFTMRLKQKVIDDHPVIKVNHSENLAVIGYFNNLHLARQLYQDTNRLGVYASALISPDRMRVLLTGNKKELQDKRLYFIFDELAMDADVEALIREYETISFIELIDFYSDKKSEIHNLRLIRKPLSTIAIAMALNEEEYVLSELESDVEFDFYAPDARVLVVDDNAVNLTVAEGLLEPLKMKIYSATSGKMALDMMKQQEFDLIFMDHMMPELDGVETTKIIRKNYERYHDTPIIALTANVVEGARDLFFSAGMNDVVPKPIEVRMLIKKVKKWLPKDKIIKTKPDEAVRTELKEEKKKHVIADLDIEKAVSMMGSEKLFFRILKEYYKQIPTKHLAIQKAYETKDWETYRIEVHALKSSSRQIGALELALMAEELEKAAGEENIERIRLRTDALLTKLSSYIQLLHEFAMTPENETVPVKRVIEGQKKQEFLDEMAEASDNLDIDGMEASMEKLSRYSYEGKEQQLFEKLKQAVDGIEVDVISEIVEEWRGIDG